MEQERLLRQRAEFLHDENSTSDDEDDNTEMNIETSATVTSIPYQRYDLMIQCAPNDENLSGSARNVLQQRRTDAGLPPNGVQTLIRGDLGIPFTPNSLQRSSSSKLASKQKPPGRSRLVCTWCNTTSAPEWRRGPNGPKSLCNACGCRSRPCFPLS